MQMNTQVQVLVTKRDAKNLPDSEKSEYEHGLWFVTGTLIELGTLFAKHSKVRLSNGVVVSGPTESLTPVTR